MKIQRKRIATGAGLGAILLTTLAGGGNPAQAGDDYYRWQNSQGDTVISDRPPPEGVTHEVIESAPLLYPEGAGAAESPAEAIADADNAQDAEATEEDATPSNVQRCERARANLEALSNTEGTVTVRTADRGARELSPEEVEIQLQATRAQIEVYCAEEEEEA